MSTNSISAIAASNAASSGTSTAVDPQLHKAAQQFEAILLRQMLAEAHKADFGATLFKGQANDTFRDMADGRFADLAAGAGTFGFARMIEKQLASQSGSTSTATSAATTTGGK